MKPKEEKMSKATIIENLKKAVAVLESSHVQGVQIGFEYASGDDRYYTAVTTKVNASGDDLGVEQHRYRITVRNGFSDVSGEPVRKFECSCPAGERNMTCRHILKAMQIEAEEFNAMFPLELASGYKAYQRFGKKGGKAYA